MQYTVLSTAPFRLNITISCIVNPKWIFSESIASDSQINKSPNSKTFWHRFKYKLHCIAVRSPLCPWHKESHTDNSKSDYRNQEPSDYPPAIELKRDSHPSKNRFLAYHLRYNNCKHRDEHYSCTNKRFQEWNTVMHSHTCSYHRKKCDKNKYYKFLAVHESKISKKCDILHSFKLVIIVMHHIPCFFAVTLIRNQSFTVPIVLVDWMITIW